MKRISYRYGYEIAHGTAEEPQIETIAYPTVIKCADADFDAAYAIALREAVGEITVEDVEEASDERIASLKAHLAATDYAVIKIAEGAATAAEYADLIEQRRAWRAEINRLEAELPAD